MTGLRAAPLFSLRRVFKPKDARSHKVVVKQKETRGRCLSPILLAVFVLIAPFDRETREKQSASTLVSDRK